MNKIDFTLVVQAFNFLVAYFVLRHLLFKPAVAVVMQEREQEKGLLKAITSEQSALATYEQEKKEQWLFCQQQFALNTPDATQQIHVDFATRIVLPTIEQERVIAMQHEVAQFIIKKVNDVNA